LGLRFDNRFPASVADDRRITLGTGHGEQGSAKPYAVSPGASHLAAELYDDNTDHE
jgi:hypothetical protein